MSCPSLRLGFKFSFFYCIIQSQLCVSTLILKSQESSQDMSSSFFIKFLSRVQQNPVVVLYPLFMVSFLRVQHNRDVLDHIHYTYLNKKDQYLSVVNERFDKAIFWRSLDLLAQQERLADIESQNILLRQFYRYSNTRSIINSSRGYNEEIVRGTSNFIKKISIAK